MTAPAWASTERVLLVGGTIHSPTDPFASALLIDGGTIAWIGEDTAATATGTEVDRVIRLEGRLVTPGFVDAHVHATSTGLTLTGLDLSETGSLAEALALVEARARHLRGGVMLGHGWDETRWPEQRPPTRQELDRATWGSVAYLSRVDVHSAVVSSALLAAVPEATALPGFDPTGPLSRQAHHAVREAALASIGTGQRDDAQRRMREHCASLGIVAVHENAGPTISGADDLRSLLSLAHAESGPLVTGYWGELAERGGIEQARDLGAHGVAGDLFIDGAIGSRTACLCQPYSDADTVGASYISEEQVAAHVIAATRAGLQAGFHVIGDAASAAVTAGLRQAAEAVGEEPVRMLGHRLEHAEMLSDDDIATLARLGVIASMQPMFDALWGGAGGMYEQRIGTVRASGMNRFADLAAAGVPVAFGSDAPVTALGPWQAVSAAMHHSNAAQRLTARAAFAAHTRAGWRAAGVPEGGVLAPGAPAHLAVWDVRDVVVQTPDPRVASWSTDPRSGTPGLPRLEPGLPVPTCDLTMVAGRVVFDRGLAA